MRFRKSNAIIGASLAFGLFFTIYLTLNMANDEGDFTQSNLRQLEMKLKNLENDVLVNQNTIEKIKETVQEIRRVQSVMKVESKAILAKGKGPVNKTFASIHKGDGGFAHSRPSTCDIRMADLYQKMDFSNPDGGVWKQGWNITYDEQQWGPEKKLRVFVMPHSHNDPGWIKTFTEYYKTQTKSILTNMVTKLTEDPRRKFIWAEISYFAMWFGEQPLEVTDKVKRLLANGQLEIVTGGWVMNDEANTYYFAMLEQMMLGHEWCRLNLNYKPQSSWAIDPFGMSPTMAYLLKRMGLDNMLIQRTHYSVKKQLAKDKSLEFKWRQHWDHDDTTDILTHMMPFYSYDIPHTCGPDPKICCQFDFLRLPGERVTCPWKVPAVAITDSNVGQRSMMLLDQYRKKSQLFKTDVVLVPLGDDFRYDSEKEWDAQFINYQKIFDYVNSKPELNAHLSFGTLTDYFKEIRADSLAKTKDEEGLFPTLSGDFFTYADRDDHYWSGYYTSRPFYKNMDRILEGYLRSAEILFSMAWAEMEYVGTDLPDLANALMEMLNEARQNLALFQHHDGVTGTAKNHVVIDYGNRMVKSISKLQVVMSQAAHYLLTPSKAFYKPANDVVWFSLDDQRQHHDSLPQRTVLQITDPDTPSRIFVFNPEARRRSEMVTLIVSTSNIRVYKILNIEGDDEEEAIPSQISPVFDDQGQISNTEFQLTFLAQAKGFSLQGYYIAQMKPEEGSNMDNDIADVQIYNSVKHPFQVAPFDNVQVFERGESFSLQNGYVRADFSEDGILTAITSIDDNQKNKVELEFVRYSTRDRGDKSGAYLFLPNGPAKPMKIERPLVRIIQGKLLSSVQVFLPWVTHTVTLKSSPGPDGTGVQIDNDVDIRKMDNAEVAMRLSTDLKSGDDFYTDLNGFQMVRRKRFEATKLPLQANYYPIPSMAYIQDNSSRLTLVTRQPLGGSSLESGQLEIMLDRRLMQDDNRGLFQGVTDNHVTPHNFFLVLERKIKGCSSDEADDVAASYPSLLSLMVRHGLINPMYRLLFAASEHLSSSLLKSYTPMDKDLACDIHVVNVRTMMKFSSRFDPSDHALLIVHRQGFNACYKPVGLTCSTNEGKMSLDDLFPELFSESVSQMSLTLLHDGLKVQKSFTVSIKPMEIYSFLMRR